MTKGNDLYYQYRKRLNKENNTSQAYKREDDKGSGTRNQRYIQDVLGGGNGQAVNQTQPVSSNKPKTREELLNQYRNTLKKTQATQMAAPMSQDNPYMQAAVRQTLPAYQRPVDPITVAAANMLRNNARGNIDLYNRPQYRQPDGSISTVNSISIGTDEGAIPSVNGKGMEVLIPTIGRDKNGRPVQWTDEQAIENYRKTGENLGKFNSIEDADKYAEMLHRQQEAYYSPENSPLRLNNVAPRPYKLGDAVRKFESGGTTYKDDPEADRYIEQSIRTSKNPFVNSSIGTPTIDPQTGDVTYSAEHGRNNWLNNYNVRENMNSDEARKARQDALNTLIAYGKGDDRTHYESTVLKNMTEDEQREYSYRLGKYGREEAEKYLDKIGEKVTNRRASEIVENVNRDVVPEGEGLPTSYVNPRTGEVIENARSGKNPINSLARAGKMGKLAAQSGLDMFVSGVGDKFTNYVTGGTEVTPATAEARASQVIKEQLNPLGRIAYDVVENEAMMLPTQAATAAAMFIAPPFAPAAAAAGTTASIGSLAAAKAAADAPQIFGIGATMFPMSAGQAYEEGIQKGMTPDQARFYGTLEGLNQAAGEYLLGGFEDLSGGYAKRAVDNVLGNVVADETKSQAAQTVARAIQHFLTTPEGRMAFSMGSEAFEEIVQGSVSNALNNAFFGENNGPVSQEDLYSGLIAALSAGMSNARYYARGYANGIGRVYSAEDIRAAADNIITDRAAYVNQEAYDAAMEQRDQMLAQADYVEQGGNLTPLEKSELGDAAGGALAEMDRIGRRARNESDIKEVADTLKTAQEIAQTEETKQEVEKISTRANDIIKRRAEGAQVTDAEVGRLINDTIRTTLTAGNEKAAATAEARTRMGFGEQGNTVMESSQATGQKAEALTALYEEARYDIKRNDAQKQLASTLLSEQELSAMYQAGIQDRNAFYNTDYSDKIGKIAEKYRPGNIKRGNVTYDGVDMDALQKAGDNESRAKYAQMKTIEHFLAGTLGYNVEWFESKTADGKYEGENGSYNRAKHLIRLDINAGAEVIGDKVKFASVIAHELTHTIENGSPMQYQKIANTVMKALVADQEYSRGRNAEQIVADMIENNPYVKNEADAVHELVAQACEDMMNGNADIRAMFEGMSESERKTIFDHISNIFAAIKNFFDDLLNSDAVRSNRTEAAAIRRAKENIESLEKEWTEGVKRAAAYNAAAYEESQRQTAEVASQNEQMENAFGDETGRITKDADGNVVIAESEDGQSMVCSLRTLPTTQAKLAEVLKRKGYSEESIKAAQDQVGTVADMLTRVSTYYAEMAEALDAELLVDPKTGKTVLHSFVTNGDYPVNIDFLTICKKREAYMHVLTDLIDHGIFDKVAFDGAAIATTNEILRDSGFETACACCFVESRRLQIQRWAETFCSEWNEEVLKRNPNATPFNFSKGDRGANSLTQEELIELDKELRSLTKKEKNDKGNYKIRQQGARAKMGPLLDRIPALGHTLSVGDLITPNGIDSMRALDSNLFSLVKQRYGTATPKIAQAFSPYNGDVADLNYGFMRTEIKESITGSKKYKAEAKSALIKEGIKKPSTQQIEDRAIRKYLYDIGGVRLQSFSDFLIENTLDYFQMFADLAAKELPLHAYSKEISFIKIFGMTGGKLNMSLIPIVDLNTDREHAGLKKNKDGTYSYAGWGDYEHHLMIDNRSFIQSIGFKDAMALQLHPGYSSHVGTIAIGISNEHIKMMLNDPLIRMVIPYHSSGMLPEFAKQMHIDYYHDYTKTQNTTLGRCTDMDGNEVPVYNLKGNDSYSCDTHFDFNEAFQRLGDARMACEEYKEWCKQQHPVYYKNKQVGWAEFTPKFVEFADERNYYKLIEDFNSYDCITEESAIQGAVRMSFPGMEENLLNDEELKAYEERLRATGQFTEKEIQKYVSRANETLEEIVTREAKNRNAYHREMDKKYDSTLKKIEKKLQKNFDKNDYVLKDNKYVRKSGEQKSSRDTASRVGSAGERFAMRGTAEETKDLIAVHNLYEWKMKQLIKLSGLPAPSIAITKANDGWNKFGEISFVYDKDSIDPKKNRKNKIYGADAWTPTFPSVEYRVDNRVLYNVSKKVGDEIKDHLPIDIANDAVNDIQRAQFDLNRMPVEEYVDRMSNSLALKAAYVASKGITVEDQQKVRGSSYKPQAVAGFDSLIEKIGNAVDEVYTEDANEFYDKYKQEILDAYNVYRDAAGLSKFEPADDSPMSRRVLIRFAEKACNYAHDTRANESIRDRDAIEKFVDSHFDRDGFDKWLTPMLSEAVLEEGLYNGKDRYTWSGTRKSWKQTHLPVTAENIVKVMMMGEKTGLASFESKNSFIASAQENFKSIADVKKSSDRIKNLDDAEYKRLTDEVGKEFYGLVDEIKSGDVNSQEAAEAIHNAVRKSRTVDGIGRELRRWGGLNIGSDTAQKVYDVAKKAASIPTKYFEAKPERVVGFDEVKAAIVPADVAPEIKEWLDRQGINTVTYERDNDADRTRALNSVENVRFSSRNSTGNISREAADRVTEDSVTAMRDNGYTAQEAAEAAEVGGFVQYSTRTAPAPKKTITAYKAFYAIDGKLYPPMVANDVEEEQNKGKKKVSGTLKGLETPVGIWIDADVGALAYDDNGKPLRNTKGRLAVKNAKGGGTLAFRPGWHLGLWPDAKQFNVKDPVTGELKACMPDGLVFARCSVAADNDYQLEALGYGMKDNGKFDRTQAGLPRIPANGYYMYRTNVDPNTAPWIISGAIRVEEILDDDMAAEICKQYGITADPRASHKKINLADYGLKAGPVTPTENTDRFLPNDAVKANAAALEEALNDPAYANAYVANSVNFDDPEIVKELARNGQSAEFYKAAQEKYGNKSYAVDNPNDSLINRNTFAVRSGDAQYSSRNMAELEAEYQEALDAKNDDWMYQLVQEAAFKAGYTTGAYHGSPFENIRVFDTRSQDTKKQAKQLLFGTHFTQNLEYAKIYARKAKNSKGTSRMRTKEGQIYNAYLDLGKSLDLRTARNITPGMEEYKLYEDAPAKYRRHFKPYTFSKYDTEQGLGSGQYITAATIESVLQAMSPKEATDFLVDHGYNSILYDADYSTATSGRNKFTRDPSIIMLDPERIKSGDPVTYDDNGNVIPLSERFDPANEDIRYSTRDSSGTELTEAQAEYFKDSKARDKNGNLLTLYHGTGSSGFTEFRITPGRGVWLTTSKRDADSYAGNFEGKLFDPNEEKSKGKSVGGSVRIGKHLRFENNADMEQFLKENPDAKDYLDEWELMEKRYALDDLDWDELDAAEDEYFRLKKIHDSVAVAYSKYELTHSQKIPLSEMLDHPERYSLPEVERAWATYDRNTDFDDKFDYSNEDEYKQVLIDGLKDLIEERAEENGPEWREDMLNMQVYARIPEGMSGEIVTRRNRTYALYANVVNPYVFDNEGRGSEGNGRFYHTIERAMADPQYDGVIVENARVGRYQDLGTVVLVKNPNQVKMTSNQNPTENEDIRYSSRNGIDQRTSFGTVEELERRNDNIKQMNYSLDEVLQNRGAQTHKLSDQQIKRIANRFIREYGSKVDADTIAEGLKTMYDYIDNAAKVSAQQVGKIATAYAEQIIDESKDVDDTMAAMYPGLADDIKRTKLYVSPEAMKEMAYYFDGAADFRRQAKKFLTISERPGDGRGIDTFYEELSESYPELFDQDVVNEKDQLLQIFDVAEQLKAKTIDKDWGSEYDEVAYTLGQDLVAAYFAEKGDSSYKRSIDQIKAQMTKDHKEQMANLRRYKDQQIKEIKDKLTGERRMNTAQIAELRARLQEQYRQREEKASLRRLTTQAKAKLQRQARQLWSKRGTPEFERLKAKLFSELDLVSVGITKGGRLSLERTYNEARKQAMLDPDYAASAEYENIKLKFLGDPANPAAERKHLRDLSYDEIVDLTQDIIALKHSQQTYNKVIKEGFEANVADYGRRAVAQQDRVKGILNQKGRRAKMLAAVKKYALYMENPVRAAHLLDGYQEGGVLTELFDDINDGTTKKTKFQQQANQMFEEVLNDKKLTDGWADQNIEINVGAGKYYISKGMRISIALHVRNADNIRHINFGGFKIPNEKLYKAGRYTDAYNAGTQVQMTEEEMKQIASEMTPEEKKFAGIAYQFFNHTTKDAINETSMVLKGYELAVVPNYMPIRTDPNFTQAEIDGLIHDGTIEGKGQFKDRQPGAKNPILLEDIAQVIERQTQTTAAYYGLAIPVRNMNKVWKYTATAYKASMKEAIAQNWGQLGKDTIEKMIKDIQAGARRGDTGDHVFSFLKGAQAASTLTMNLGVSIKQFASYPLAISMIDADCLMKGLRAKTDRAYIDSITPWSWDRRHGMGGEEMGDIFKQKGMIARNQTVQNIKNMVNWIQAVDVFTTDHLFSACEAQVQKDNPDLEVRGEEYNKKVAALYNDVLWRTQPSYGVMQRNELMRSASSIMKALTMYKTQTFNMGGEIIDAGLRAITMNDMAKNGLVSNDEAKKARQDLKKVLWGTVLSQATLAALSAVAAAVLRKMRPYRDDKGEITAGSLIQKVGTDFITSWFGLFFGADLAEQAVGSVLNFAKWYDVTAPQLDGLNDTVSDMSAWSTALGDYIGETDADKKAEKKSKLVKTSAKMAMTTAGTFGVPTTNVYNMLNALNLLLQDVSEDGGGFLSFEAGEGLLGLTDTSPTKEQYARQAVYYSEREEPDKVAHALQGTNKANLEKVLGAKLTKNLYDSFMDDPENLAKYMNVKQGVSAPKPSDVPDEGYASFTKLREAIGDPERTQNWHHIVEQEQGPGDGNFGRFSATQINNKNNIVSIPSGAKSPHSAISKYYDSAQDFTGGKTVREWLSTKSFEEQFDFGVKQLQKYGDIIPTSNGWVFVPDDQKIEAAMPLKKGKADVRTDTQKQWETRMAELREDGGLTGREVRDAALTMLKDGLTSDEAIELYRSNQKSDKNLDKWKGGFEDYLNSRNAIDDAKAIKDSDKKRQKEKRKQAVEDYLRQYHGTKEDELLLWKLAGYGEKTFVYR